MTLRSWLLAYLAVVGLAVSCSDDATGPSADAGQDVVDSGADFDLDAADSEADSGDLATPDAAVDADLGAEADVDDVDASADADIGGPDYPAGPPQIVFTVNELPAELNGSLPYSDDGGDPTEFTLAVPTWGFTFDLLADRPPAGLDPESLEVVCDQPFGAADERLAETDLSDLFDWEGGHLRWLVPESLLLAEGRVTCDARVGNLDGELSDWSAVGVDAVTLTAARDPFPEPDVWVVTFSRDYYDVSLEIGAGDDYQVTGTIVEGGNGEPDFFEDLRLLGFLGDESGEGAATLEARGVTGVNNVMKAWIIETTMRQVRGHYGVDAVTGLPTDSESVRIHLFLEGDPGAPSPAVYDGTFSIHGVGGDSPASQPSLFGLASDVDVLNLSTQDDARLGWGSFTTNVSRTIIQQAAGRFLLREFVPGLGTPLGEIDVDAVILADDFVRSEATQGERWRYNQLTFALELYTKMLAALIAHEMGHSLGLVACGAPPGGLFSGINDPSIVETDAGCGHIDTAGLNIMQTGASLLANPGDLAGEVSFGPLSMAYLRRRVVILR